MSTTTTSKILEGCTRYRIKEKIGSGGMATVYIAEDTMLQRDVALKIMHEHLLSSPDTVKRFTNEAHAVASLSHENIIKVFDYGEIETRPFLVMEYIRGSTLISLIDRNGALPNLAAIEIARQILSGLSAAHEKGIFHRDVKPDNIMIDHDGTVKIMDFGIAYVVNSESLTLTGSFIGSPRFISPEQAKGEHLSGTTDIFSLGVLLYFSITGVLPFNADVPAAVVHSIIHDTPDPACVRNRKTLFWISGFIDACLIKSPRDRPDALAALALIEKEMLLHGLTTSKALLCEYISDPTQYHESEEKKLYEHYRRKAHEAVKNRQIARTVKSLEQARSFGPLQPEDERAIRNYNVRRTVKKVAAITAAATLCVTAMLLLIVRLAPLREGTDPPAPPVTDESRILDSIAVESPMPVPETPVNAQQVLKGSPSRNPQKSNKRQVDTIHAAPPSSTVAAPAWLSIRTNPPWSKVFIDDIERGTTPSKTVYTVKAGPHEVKIIKDGFTAHHASYAPSGNETLEVRVMLNPLSQQNQ
jgi:serine/threonine protein kinase